MRLIPSCVAVFLSLCFDSLEYRPNACKTSSVVIGVVRIVAKYQPIVYYLLRKEFAFTDMTEAILSTIRISSRLAPASSAARMWRRVSSRLRFVQAAFKATPISSTVLRGRTPEARGLVDMFTHVSAHFGSLWRSWASAVSHGPVSCGWSLASPSVCDSKKPSRYRLGPEKTQAQSEQERYGVAA